MKANSHNIWARTEEGYPHPAQLTEEQVKSFEAEMDLPLPQSLIDLLKIQNGGSLCFELPDCLNSMIWGIGPDAAGSLFRLDQEDHGYPNCPEQFPIHDLIAFDGDGHWYLCLDYRKNSIEPAVTYVDLGGDSLWEETIAPSFQAYLEKLQLIVDDFYILEPNWDLEIVIKQLEDGLMTSFMAPDIWMDRPETRMAKFFVKGQIEWVYLSTNLTSSLSAPQTESSFLDKSLAPEKFIKYPFLKAGSYLLEITPDAVEIVVEILGKSGIFVRHLRDYY